MAYAVRRVLTAPSAPRHPLVVGAGGTARAALAALAATGAARAGVVARRPSAARPLVEIGAAVGVNVSVLPWDTLSSGVPPEVDLVVATTPPGATDALAARPWPAETGLVELLYHPWPTRLAARAHTCGARVAGGLAVLAAQAVEQVELFTGARVDVGLLLSAGQAELATRSAPDAVPTLPAAPAGPGGRLSG
jgi:shikimate dehydrogenase